MASYRFAFLASIEVRFTMAIPHAKSGAVIDIAPLEAALRQSVATTSTANEPGGPSRVA
jgi:hypothetical protein